LLGIRLPLPFLDGGFWFVVIRSGQHLSNLADTATANNWKFPVDALLKANAAHAGQPGSGPTVGSDKRNPIDVNDMTSYGKLPNDVYVRDPKTGIVVQKGHPGIISRGQ
jgi:hypothetical protein